MSKWQPYGYRTEALVGSDGEILATVHRHVMDSGADAWPLQKQYISVETAKKAAERHAKKESEK